MKTIIKVTLCFFIFVNTLFAQWIETETEYPNRITDLSFLNSNTGYAITARLGTTAQTYLLKTTNKGNSWNLVYIFYDFRRCWCSKKFAHLELSVNSKTIANFLVTNNTAGEVCRRFL
ncbi:MAG: hypothetical protein IPM38_11535 [Ignavibacteria bacterium]|nr:hypothetical protein [Ignavibacteria bacterium]